MEPELTIDDILRAANMNRDMMTGYVRSFMRTAPVGTIIDIPIDDTANNHVYFLLGLKLNQSSYRFSDSKEELEKMRMLFNIEPPTIVATNATAATASAVNAITSTTSAAHAQIVTATGIGQPIK